MVRQLLVSGLALLLTITRSDIYSCPRVHKAWHLTTEEEKQLFISGVHKLNNEGKLKYFGLAHQNIVDQAQAHDTSEFFAWHRYFLWEFENQIRRLGPEYECFATPYWDVTTDAGEFEKAHIFNSGVGGPGDQEHDECVNKEDDGAWSRSDFPLEHVCHERISAMDNPSNGCCLKRAAARGQDLSGVSAYVKFVKEYNNFGAADGFRAWTFWGMHGEVHGYVGGGWANYTHMISRFASEDPIFYMLHTWLDYVFVVWKQCWGYDQISAADLDAYPDAYFSWPKEDKRNGVPSSDLDDPIYYVPMHDLTWFQAAKYMPTARKLYNEKDWNIQYERGTFIARSHLTALCSNQWDPTVLLPNSDETNLAIEQLRDNDGESEVDRYQHRVWNYYMDNKDFFEQYDEQDWLATWNSKTCNFERQRLGKGPCYIPLDYEKCTEDDYGRRNELTLEELLNKEGVKGNDCLEEIRYNSYPWAKNMGMLYELCMGKLDKYRLCKAPLIDFLIDSDDEAYYDEMISIKQKMKQEALEKEIKLNQKGDAFLLDMNEKPEVPIIAGLGDLPQFDVVGYLIMAFMVGFCALIAMIGHCMKEYNTRVVVKGQDKESKLNYGSMIEML